MDLLVMINEGPRPREPKGMYIEVIEWTVTVMFISMGANSID